MNIFSKKSRARDPKLFLKILYDTYKEKVYRIAYYILGNEHDAKDVVQDTFITVYNKIDQLKDYEKISSWICVIASNLAKSKYNKKKKETLVENDRVISLIDPTSCFNIPEELLLQKEFKEYLLKQMNELQHHYRELLVLYYYGGLSYEEISQVLNENIGTVKSRLFRAKKILKKTIERDRQYKTILDRNEGYHEEAEFI